MPLYEIELSPPMLIIEVAARNEDEAVDKALRAFEEQLIDGTWSITERDEDDA